MVFLKKDKKVKLVEIEELKNSKYSICIGMQGIEVYQLQLMLNEMGFYNGIMDGVYGIKTLEAVNEYKRLFNNLNFNQFDTNNIEYDVNLRRLFKNNGFIKIDSKKREHSKIMYSAGPCFEMRADKKYYSERYGMKIDTLVFDITYSNFLDKKRKLENNELTTSAHFYITTEGKVISFVPLENSASHSKGASSQKLPNLDYRSIYIDIESVGAVEHKNNVYLTHDELKYNQNKLGHPEPDLKSVLWQPIHKKSVEAAIALSVFLNKRFSFSFIERMNDINPNSFGPGDLFPVEEIRNEINKLTAFINDNDINNEGELPNEETPID